MIAQNNIPLRIAMNEEFDYLKRVWSVPGLHIEEEISEGEECISTDVCKHPKGPYVLSLVLKKDNTYYGRNVGTFLTLTELAERQPKLFEMNGMFFGIVDL